MDKESLDVPVTKPLSVADPELPILITRAVIEFDNAAQGVKTSFLAAQCLAEFLRDSFHRSVDAGSPVTKLDFGEISIFGAALRNTEWKAKSVRDIVEKAWDVAASIDVAEEKNKKNDFLQLRNFCIALGNNLTSYWDSIDDQLPSNPYRR